MAGETIASAVTLIDGLVVIGGGLSGASKYILPALMRELNAMTGMMDGSCFPRLQMKAFNLENAAEMQEFLEGKVTKVQIPWVITLPEYVKKYQPGAQVPLYSSAVLDKQPSSFGTFQGEKQQPGARELKGVGAGVYLTYDFPESDSVTAKIGLSYTSVENARLNLEAEAKDFSFDEAKEQSHRT